MQICVRVRKAHIHVHTCAYEYIGSCATVIRACQGLLIVGPLVILGSPWSCLSVAMVLLAAGTLKALVSN